ncbi:MAG: tetratricopeptide repeat protein, partial [Armatimonadetes bacterium]|nr:tetratricopeptide repeat protein [Armatimonadota bacterium]
MTWRFSATRCTGQIFLLLLSCAAPAQLSLRQQLYNSWLREGLKREQAGNWVTAADCYREALKYNPEGRDASFHLARCLANSGQSTAAVKLLRGLLRRQPDDAEAALLLVRLLSARGETASVISVLQSALSFRPGHPGLLEEIGSALLRLGKPEEAAVYLERAARAGADGYRLHLLLGRCYAALNRPVEAEQHLLAAAADETGSPAAQMELLNLYLGSGRWLDALALARGLAHRSPRNATVWQMLGHAALALADVQTAAEAYRKALSLTPGPERRLLALRIVKRALASDAAEVVASLLSTPGAVTDAELAAYQACALEALGRKAEAAAVWERWASHRPDFLGEAARCWLAEKRPEKAVQCLVRLGERDPAALQQAAAVAAQCG